jgi:hypothetical protein
LQLAEFIASLSGRGSRQAPRCHRLNDWLADKCIAYAKAQAHPDAKEKTVFEMLEAERPALMPDRGAFDGFHAVSASVSKTCLVRFDRNKYSVAAKAVGRPVDIHAYAERIVMGASVGVVGQTG